MGELMSTNRVCGTLSTGSGTSTMGDFVSELLAAVPSALARPIIEYQKTKAQKELYSIAIEARRRERTEILKTMQVLARHGQLTPELSQQLMTAYYQPPFPNY